MLTPRVSVSMSVPVALGRPATEKKRLGGASSHTTLSCSRSHGFVYSDVPVGLAEMWQEATSSDLERRGPVFVSA